MQDHTTPRFPGKTLEEKFWLYTEVGPFMDCWLWHGPTDYKQGYGRLYYERHKHIKAHRLSYILHNGPIPDNLLICHTCDNPQCVNPNHLYAGTHLDNAADAKERNRLKHPDNSGENHGLSKLTEAAVLEIRRLYAEGHTRQSLAEKFGVLPGTISKVTLRQRWKHI